MLSLLFNLCIVHGFLPDHLISSVLIPIVKDKSGDVMDKGNYRPIALSSVISKVLEVYSCTAWDTTCLHLTISLGLSLSILPINVYIYIKGINWIL